MTEQPNNPKADAKAAKAYYKASRPWYKKKRWIAAMVLLVCIIIGSLSGGGSSDKPEAASDNGGTASSSPTSDSGSSSTKASKPKATPKPTAKAMNVKAGQILKEFDENEAAADGKYKGKTFRVTGIVGKVDTELIDDNQYIIQVGSGSDYEFTYVNCNDISSSVAAKVNKGAKVSVLGEFDDGGDLGVELKDCSLVAS